MLIEQGKTGYDGVTFAEYGNEDFTNLYYVIKLSKEHQFRVFRSLKRFDDNKSLQEDMNHAIRKHIYCRKNLDKWCERHELEEVVISTRV